MPISETKVFGRYTQTIPPSPEYLTLSFSLNTDNPVQRWSNYGLSADFLGDYFSAFFPKDAVPDSKIDRSRTVRSAVSYVTNELLENAVKYSDVKSDRPVTIFIYLYSAEIIVKVVNYASDTDADRYLSFVQRLQEADPSELYLQQLEQTAMGTGNSCMGILTMLNDYGAEFGWEFHPVDDRFEICRVSVIVHLKV